MVLQGEVAELGVGHLVPGQRRGDRGVGHRPHRVGGRHGAVLGVLVVVDEDAVALLLPPLAGGDVGRAPLDLAGHGQGGAAHLGEAPARARSARRRGSRASRRSSASRPGRGRPARRGTTSATPPDIGPRHAGTGIEVDPQLIGVVEVVGAHGVRVEVDAAQVDDPGQRGAVGDHHLVGGAARWKGQLDGARRSSGTDFGARFWKNASPVMPSTKRFSAIGRSRTPRSAPSATAR